MDWIEHDGKGSPDLPEGTEVYVRGRDGWESEKAFAFESYDDSYDPADFRGRSVPRVWKSWWVHHGDADDITHYRIVTPQQ